MGRGMMGHGMMGHGGMMGPPFAMRIIFALMDGDGDGTISLQEFQAAHDKSSRQWMPTKMAWSLWRKCRPSCGDRVKSASQHE